ncbi:uncharacterized protein SPSK_03435 [Sporothrix schenckii 1099-18]|uniref:Uncharacterized protein n=1 Tax=Sporothrix schenckii 1099-18 TaxID=1397361 RepID=A0A0F2M1W0_SPOSC|nr:uncharacterized protein SPSK_03435 [Sporothrix schenckii 1099-18]KJR82121.1 hypothetical protein SPSK_03435 [Sporothrix schenckii 1099-18]
MAEPVRRRPRRRTTEADADVNDAHNRVSGDPPAADAPNAPPSMTAASSSFFTVPTAVLSGVGLPPISGIVGRCIYNRVARHVREGPARQCLQCILTAKDGLLVHVWAVLQASVFRGHAATAAAPYLLAAVVLNHARRALFFGHPAAGFFVRPQPDDDWRLLLARPDVFVEDVVKAVERGAYLQAVAWKGVWDMLGAAMAIAATANDAAPHSLPLIQSKNKAVARTLVRRAKDVAATLFTVWLFSSIEYAVAQASATLAVGYAAWTMLRVPGKGGPDRLASILFDKSLRTQASILLFCWLQMVVYPVAGLAPLVARSVSRPLQRPGVLPALAFACVAMDTVVRYRSRLYIAIETSGLFVFLGYVCISAMMVGANRMGRRTTGEANQGGNQRKN